jgi:hypothetical protein
MPKLIKKISYGLALVCFAGLSSAALATGVTIYNNTAHGATINIHDPEGSGYEGDHPIDAGGNAAGFIFESADSNDKYFLTCKSGDCSQPTQAQCIVDATDITNHYCLKIIFDGSGCHQEDDGLSCLNKKGKSA